MIKKSKTFLLFRGHLHSRRKIEKSLAAFNVVSLWLKGKGEEIVQNRSVLTTLQERDSLLFLQAASEGNLCFAGYAT